MSAVVRDAGNLFGEVVRYDVPGPSERALLANAELVAAFAKRVGTVSQPTDLEGREAMMFRSELEDSKRTLENKAALLLEQAATSGAADVAREACALLAAMGRSSQVCP